MFINKALTKRLKSGKISIQLKNGCLFLSLLVLFFDKSINAKQIPARILSRNNHTVFTQGFLCYLEGSDRKRMTAVEFYPEGIGKHIVCIYSSLTAAALQTACRGEPRTPNNTTSGNKQR